MKYIIILFSIILFFACQPKNTADFEVKAELQLIDTLKTRLDEVKSWLDEISLEEIKERKELIEHNYQYCDMRYRELKKVVDLETAVLMDEYKGYGKLYGRAAESYKPIVLELEELYVQLKTLKESAYSKDYKKELFLDYFHREKDSVEKLHQYSTKYLKTILETDLMFERAEKRVEEIAEELKQQ